MDAFEAAGGVHDRIKELEPNAPKWMTRIMLMTSIPKQELIRLALGPDHLILKLIQKLYNASKPNFEPFEPPINYYDSSPNYNVIQSCRYFNKGYCKHGDNCRYYHGEYFRDSDEFYHDSKLEMEVVQLLKSQRGNAIPIASLPMMYYDMYGRTLQAEGYLSESQRHGKAGYSLTKLLARLNSIRLIDRPHGQHEVVLAEDAHKYMNMQGEHDPSTRQIYLTFPPESTFEVEDVFNYFMKFGLVEDVRIPWQVRRMFGFVTFASANTVKLILSKGCPHYVCGARILVKPYREKSKFAQRKYLEKSYSYSYPIDHTDSRLQYRTYATSYTDQEYMNALRQDKRRLSQHQLATPSYFMVHPRDEMNAADYTNMYITNNDAESVDQELNLPERPFESP